MLHDRTGSTVPARFDIDDVTPAGAVSLHEAELHHPLLPQDVIQALRPANASAFAATERA